MGDQTSYSIANNETCAIGYTGGKEFKMTKEEKMEWIRNASNEALLQQHRQSSINAGRNLGLPKKWSEHNEDAKMIEAEILKRMQGAQAG